MSSTINQTEDDIWSQILRESSNKNNYFEKKHVIMLGDPNCGKSLLLSKFNVISDVEVLKSIALSYTFSDVFEDEISEDPIGRINFWSLEGETAHNDLLKFALNIDNIKSSLIMITLDFSQPWNVVDSLKKWLTILEDHIKSIFKDNKIAYKELQDKLLIKWHEYVEPSSNQTNNSGNASGANTSNGTATIGTSNVQKKKIRRTNTNTIEDTSVLPVLGENILIHNLGVPILIVCCKSDSVVMLEKDFDYKDDLFDYIQQYLRRISLQYGAGLIYASARKDINCDVSLEYIENMLFGFELKSKTQLLEKDQIFVPAGWDTIGKITVDFENQKVCKDPEEPYENVVKKPPSIKRREMSQQQMITAYEDQEFLQNLKHSLENETEEMGTKLEQSDLDNKAKLSQMNNNNAINAGDPNNPGLQTTSPTNPLRSSTGVSGTQNPEKAALANFFTSLISKDRSTSRTSLTSSSNLTSTRSDAQKELEKLKQNNGTSTPKPPPK